METIKLDLIPGKKMPSLHASQYDDGREHGIVLFENGVAYKLDGTEMLTINERKGDDCICSLDIENTFIGSNHIVFASTEQMCAVWGNNLCELVIAKDEKTIGTLNFIFEVEPSPTEGGIESESEIKNLKRQVEAITEEVIGEDYYTKIQTDEAIENATEGKADKTYVDMELDKKADKNNTYTKTQTYNKQEVDDKIAELPEAMVFKGTLGVNGDIQTLPTPSASNEGWTFKCITAGTYAGLTLKVGDTVTCFNPPNTSDYEWDISGYGDTDTDTWRAVKVNGTEELGSGISSGSVDFVGSENIDVEFDSDGNKIGIKTKNIYTKSEVDDIVYGILPDDTASGSVANFTTSLELPIKSLEVDVNAVQESGTPTPATPLPISGRSAISPVHCHKNLYQYDESKVSTGTTTTSTIRAYYPLDFKGVTSLTFSANLKSGSSITASDYLNIGKLRKSDGLIEILSQFITPDGITTRTLSISSDDVVVLVSLENPTVIKSILSRYDVQIEVGSSASTYESFNGTTVVINLGGTYYGGHFTQDKAGHRQFEVTFKRDLLKNWIWTRNSTDYAFAYFSTTNVTDKANNKNFVCEIFANNNNYRANLSNNEIGVYNNTTGLRRFCVRCDEATTPEEFNTIIGDYAIIYELATPYVIDLPDGEPIITINGTNNIYADTGDSAVEYKVSVEQYVSNHSGGGGAKSLGGVFLGGSNSGSEEEPTEESEETEKVKEIDEPKEEIKTIVEKKIGGE